MGIKGINNLIKRYAANAYFAMPISSLSGKRIAIDGHYWMYSNMATARKKVINRTDVSIQEPSIQEIRREWFLCAINFIVTWLTHNITPVFVFDGEHLTEKDNTKAKRKDTRLTSKAKIDAIYQQLNDKLIEPSPGVIEELRKELRNYNNISSEDFELFKMVIKGIGIPCLQAKGDGEQLCSSLCVEGYTAAVYSVDTDNLVYGCPLLVTGFSDSCTYDKHGDKVINLDCVRLDYVLQGMGITHSFFVDLCIMSGCDFNTNIPGYAAIKAFKLLQQYNSIDNLPNSFNITCLNHIRCREIFTFVPTEQLLGDPEEPFELNVNKESMLTARDYLNMVGISGQIDRLILLYTIVGVPSNGHVESLNLTPVPHYTPPKRKIYLNIVPSTPTPAPKSLVLNIISPSKNKL